MKKTQLINLFAILLIVLFSAANALAQNVEIKNNSGENDDNLCVNKKKAFNKKQFELDSTGKFQALPCTAQNERQVRFRRLEDPKTNQAYYYLTF